MKVKKNILYIAGILLCILVAAYSNHFNNSFHFDDSHTVVDNVSIRTLKNIPAFFTDPTMFSVSQNHRGLRPLVTTTLAIDYWIAGGLNSSAFHVSVFLWHIGLCVMLFFVYRQLLSKSINHSWVPYIAIMGAGWFGIHTVMAETINYIISRSDVLSTFFIVASFLVYVVYPQKRKYFIYVLLAVIGVFAKETVPVLPILLFFYIVLFEKKLSLAAMFRKSNMPVIGKVILQLLPLIIVVAAVQLYTLSASTTDASTSHGMNNPLGYYLLTQTYVWLHYFRSFFLPFGLSADTDLGVITNIADPRIIAGIIFVVLLIGVIFKTSHKAATRPVSFGLIWFAASLLPTSLVPFAEVMNDHRMYFAFTGLTLSIVSVLGLWVIKYSRYFEKRKNYRWLIMGALLVIGLHAYGVYKRNQVWYSEETLWKNVTEKSPANGRGWMNYGLTLMGKADFAGAIDAYKRSEEINPTYSSLFINYGIAYGALNDTSLAVQNFNKAILLAPNDYNSYTYFARYYLEKGKPAQAKPLAERAMALNSSSYFAKDVAMQAYHALKMWPQLQNTANATLLLVPGDVKALQYLQAANQKKEIHDAQALTSSNMPSAEALLNLSLQQYNEGKYEDCITTCRLALQINPGYADAYNNICAAYNMLKEWDKAKEACTKALQLNPDHPNAPANLRWAIKQKAE